MDIPKDLITVAEARQLLSIGHTKMAQLIRDGFLRYYITPMDRRVRLVSRAAVEQLKTEARAA
jgi:excisionase family DNA binding protein